MEVLIEVLSVSSEQQDFIVFDNNLYKYNNYETYSESKYR
jgi:hypothetical protein